jgi:protein-S-isoprenylcysteine O-methyltransferase Ste14
VVIFGVFTSFFVLLAILVDGLINLPPLLPGSARWVVSIPVVAAGIVVTTWSAVPFLQAKGTPVPFNPPPTLVTTAPYRFARNPMVTGVILILIGIGFAVRSVSLVFVPLYLLVNVWELRQIEEPELVRRFGDEYLEYRQRTPMFFPRLKRRTGRQ